MKYLLYIFLTLTFRNTAVAQTEAFSLSLKQAIELGLKNRNDIKSGQYDVLISENAIKQSKKGWIPEIEGSADIRYNTELSKTIVPAGVLGNPEPMAFSLDTKTNSVYALNLTQPLYKAELINDTRIAKNNLAIEKERRIQAETAVILNITQSYLNVLLKELQYKLAKENESRYEAYLHIAADKYKLRALVENDYLKTQLDYQNAIVTAKNQQQDYNLAINALKYHINIQDNAALVLTDTLKSVLLSLPFQQQGNTAANRPELKQLLLAQENNRLQLKKVRQRALPAVSLFGSYASQFQYKSFDYSQNDWWTQYSYVGIKLSVPITSHLKNSSTVNEFRLRIVKGDFDLKQKFADVDFEIRQALAEINNAYASLEEAKANLELSKTIISNNKKQFELGVFQYTAILESEKSITTAEEKYIQLTYDYLLARYNWMKATGNVHLLK